MADQILLSPIVEGELRAGLHDPMVKPGDRTVTLAFIDAPRVRRLVITGATAVRWASIRFGLRRAGHMLPINDVWIAASAMEHGLPVVTSDAHFLEIPQILVEFLPQS